MKIYKLAYFCSSLLLLSACVCTDEKITDQESLTVINGVGYSIGLEYVTKTDLFARKMKSPHNRFSLEKPGVFLPEVNIYRKDKSKYSHLILIEKGTSFKVTGFYLYECKGLGPLIEIENIFQNGLANVMLSAVSKTDYTLGVPILIPDEEYIQAMSTETPGMKEAE